MPDQRGRRAGSWVDKLRTALEEHLTDPEEREFVEPRLAHLLGLAEYHARDKQDLFAAWRLFFERLADVHPTVLAFEDMQWADESLLDFVEYLLDWSRNSPLYVVTLARPELADRRPTWGAGQRAFTSLYLEPLSDGAMEELLAGLVPGLPDATRRQILDRAEGVPLYAVETVRMLLDRGVLVQEESVYRLTGEIETLEVPETLHALIAARLDGLSTAERALLQDACVLGKTFTKDALAALGSDGGGLDGVLASLVRKEVLGLQTDPRSPEHGQYGFLQDLVRHVAYGTISKRDRRTKHLAAAHYLSSAFPSEDDELVEVIASHYLAARAAAPEADDAAAIKDKARAMLTRAAQRAQSLAAAAEARRYFEQAAGLSDEIEGRARLLARAGDMAALAADPDSARAIFETAISLYEQLGDTHAAARVTGRLARVESMTGRTHEALPLMERAFEVISIDEPDEDLALLAANLAIAYWRTGSLERALERAEFALDISEAHGYMEVTARALGAKGAVAHSRGHTEETIGLVRQGLAIALENDLLEQANTYYFWLSDFSFHRDRYADALGYLDQAVALARKLGSRPGEWSVLAERTYALAMTGRWDEAVEASEQLSDEQARSGGMFLSLISGPLEIHLQRGNLAEARRLHALFEHLDGSLDKQELAAYLGATAAVARAEGRFADALDAGRKATETRGTLRLSHQCVEQGLVEALEASVALGERDVTRQLLALIEEQPLGQRPPFLDAQAHRFRGRLDDDSAALETATIRFRELEMLFWVAVTQLEQAELLGSGADANRLRTEARETFERLAATPWLERATVVAVAPPA